MAAKSLCKIDGCNKPVIARGWCENHYRRWKRHGDPETMVKTARGEALDYFLHTVIPYDGDECLFWPYVRHDWGYGVLHFEGRNRYVHRLICEEEHGPAPSPIYEAAHSCGNGHLGCVNRKHLSWKTPKQNSDDKYRHGTMTRGEECHAAKLTREDVKRIRTLKGKKSSRQISEEFGVGILHVNAIWRRDRWAWLR